MIRLLLILATLLSVSVSNAAIVFALRGTFTARYSNGGPDCQAFGNTIPVTAADAGAISGNSITFAANTNFKAVTCPGRLNTPNNRTMSVLIRFKPAYTTAPATNQGIYSIAAGSGNVAGCDLVHNTAGNLIVTCKNESAGTSINAASAGAWAPTAGTWYDIVFTWDGNTTANAGKVYVDGTLIGSGITAASARTTSWNNKYMNAINIGISMNGSISNAGVYDEVIIWDSVIDPTAVVLDAGTEALDGAGRSSPVTATAFDGSIYTDPGVNNVLSTASYTFAGTAMTPNYVVVTTGNVRNTITFGSSSGQTGTLKPASHGH